MEFRQIVHSTCLVHNTSLNAVACHTYLSQSNNHERWWLRCDCNTKPRIQKTSITQTRKCGNHDGLTEQQQQQRGGQIDNVDKKAGFIMVHFFGILDFHDAVAVY